MLRDMGESCPVPPHHTRPRIHHTCTRGTRDYGSCHGLRPQPSCRVQRPRVPCSRLLLCAHAGSRSPLELLCA
eukprot:6032960-Prymnesium_polylepis.1